MNGNVREELSDFLKNAFANMRAVTVNLDSFVITLYVVLPSGGENSIEVYHYQLNQRLESFVEAILGRVEREVSSVGGGTFCVRVDQYGGRYTIPMGDHPAAIMHRKGAHGGDLHTENPAALFVSAMIQDKIQSHQHIQELMRMAVGAQTDAMKSQQQTIREQSETLRSYEKARVEQFGITEKLYSMGHERELEMRRELKNEERKDQALDMFGNAMPQIAAHLMGAKSAPPQDPDLENFAQAFGNVNDEQLQRMIASGVFTDDQIKAIIRLRKSANGNQQSAEAAE